MKKIHLVFVSMFILAIAAVFVFKPVKAVSQQKFAPSSIVIPDDVSKILQNSCTSCHDKGGKAIAKAMWSLASWDKYSVKKQIKKANMICWAINKGIMPPKAKAKKFPDMVPTAAQKEIVCKWANSLNAK
jgi:hypothetical protein